MNEPDQLRNFQDLRDLKFDDERYKTATSIDQVRFVLAFRVFFFIDLSIDSLQTFMF